MNLLISMSTQVWWVQKKCKTLILSPGEVSPTCWCLHPGFQTAKPWNICLVELCEQHFTTWDVVVSVKLVLQAVRAVILKGAVLTGWEWSWETWWRNLGRIGRRTRSSKSPLATQPVWGPPGLHDPPPLSLKKKCDLNREEWEDKIQRWEGTFQEWG